MSKKEIKDGELKEKVALMLDEARELRLTITKCNEQLDELAGEIGNRKHRHADVSGYVRQALLETESEIKEEAVMAWVIENTTLAAEIADLVDKRVEVEIARTNAEQRLEELTDKLARGLDLDDDDDNDDGKFW